MLKKVLRNKALWLTLFMLLLLAISWQSLVPKPLNAFAYTSDKLLHFLGWFSVGLCLLLSLNKHLLLSSLLLLLYSIGIECGQHFIPGRFFSYLDIAANGLGIITAWLIHRLMKNIYL